jgi:uncharacterized protein YcgI (DUF1989 family)
MAKKTAKKKAAPAKKSTSKKAAPKKAPAKKVEHVEIQLSPAETAAFELAHSSEEVCKELEEAVTAVMGDTIRKVFKKHKISLTQPEGQQVALLLFGDD